MLPMHVTNSDGSVGPDPELERMWHMMKTDRFKVSRMLSEWFDEERDYHRDENGNVVPLA